MQAWTAIYVLVEYCCVQNHLACMGESSSFLYKAMCLSSPTSQKLRVEREPWVAKYVHWIVGPFHETNIDRHTWIVVRSHSFEYLGFTRKVLDVGQLLSKPSFQCMVEGSKGSVWGKHIYFPIKHIYFSMIYLYIAIYIYTCEYYIKILSYIYIYVKHITHEDYTKHAYI